MSAARWSVRHEGGSIGAFSTSTGGSTRVAAHRGAVIHGAYEGPHGRRRQGAAWAVLNRAYSMSTGGQYRSGRVQGGSAGRRPIL